MACGNAAARHREPHRTAPAGGDRPGISPEAITAAHDPI